MEEIRSEPTTVPPMTIDKAKILYIIPFRAKNLYRKKNLRCALDWISTAKEYLKSNYEVDLDVCIVEQDKETTAEIPKDGFTHLFLTNSGILNKGWGFNVVVKQNPNYQYYGFGDADIIVPDIEVFCDQIIEHTSINPKKAFRPFNERLDTQMTDSSLFNTYSDLKNMYPSIKGRLTKHGGLSFASNMIFMSNETFETIGGWDEAFRGWGRFDDFITHKLRFMCQCNAIYAPVPAIHLWHPVTIDFSLNPENVHLYDKYVKFGKDDLLKLIEGNRRVMGDSNFYKNH